MRRCVLALLSNLLLLPGAAAAQGFAGLGIEAEGFARPERGYDFSFPQDHGAHPAFRIEWWYLTANLEDEAGAPLGLQWTLFRSALSPEGASEGWQTPQLYMGHAAVTTANIHLYAERLGRGGVGQAGVRAAPFLAFIDEWAMEGEEAGDGQQAEEDALGRLSLRARGERFSYDLDLVAEGPLVFHGEEGYSVKAASGQASLYYSQPFYAVKGEVEIDGKSRAVTGKAWLDREISSQPLSESQEGWDWVSLHLDDGRKLMGFALRSRAGVYTSASLIEKDGTLTAFPDGALRMTPLRYAEVAGRKVPTHWRVELPEKGIEVTVRALNDDAFMATRFAYWEGPVTVTGSHEGEGYLEMTGYGEE